MKVGLFGGTFDPIHNAHLLLAEWIKEELNFNKIVFIPAYIPPHKQNRQITSPSVRLYMVRLAIQGNPHFEVSDVEIRKGHISYSVETIQIFRQQYNLSAEQLYFIIGADSFVELHTWRSPEKILQDCQVVVYKRWGYDISKVKKKFLNKAIILDNPIIDISSSKIRNYISNEHSIKYMVPTSVEAIIYRKALYKKKC